MAHEEQLERLAAWLDEVLPSKGANAVLQRDEADFRVAESGWIDIPILVASLEDEEIGEVAVGHALHHLHLEDLDPPQEERTRAYLAAWSKAMVRWLDDDFASPTDRLHRATLYWVIENLGLQTEEDFFHEIDAARWLDSPPDVALYPDLDLVPEPFASDPSWEAEVAATLERSEIDRYSQWLHLKKDPRGEANVLASEGTAMGDRRAFQLIRDEQRYFLGPFPLGEPSDFWQETVFIWAGAWIDELIFKPTLDKEGPAPAAILDAVFRLPAARFLRVLRIEPELEEIPMHRLRRWTDALQRESDALRELHLVRTPAMDRKEDEEKLRARFVHLETLRVE